MLTLSLTVLYLFKNIYLKVSWTLFFTFQVFTYQTKKGYCTDYRFLFLQNRCELSLFLAHTYPLHTPNPDTTEELLPYQLKEQRSAKISFPESVLRYPVCIIILFCQVLTNKYLVWSDSVLKKQQVVAGTIKQTILEARQEKSYLEFL